MSQIDKFIIDVDSCNPEMLALKGIALFELGKFLDADLWLYKYLTLNPKDVEIIWYKSSTLLKLKNFYNKLKKRRILTKKKFLN